MENSKKGLQNYWSLLQCVLQKQRQLTASTGSVISPITDLKMQILEPNPALRQNCWNGAPISCSLHKTMFQYPLPIQRMGSIKK